LSPAACTPPHALVQGLVLTAISVDWPAAMLTRAVRAAVRLNDTPVYEGKSLQAFVDGAKMAVCTHFWPARSELRCSDDAELCLLMVLGAIKSGAVGVAAGMATAAARPPRNRCLA